MSGLARYYPIAPLSVQPAMAVFDLIPQYPFIPFAVDCLHVPSEFQFSSRIPAGQLYQNSI